MLPQYQMAQQEAEYYNAAWSLVMDNLLVTVPALAVLLDKEEVTVHMYFARHRQLKAELGVVNPPRRGTSKFICRFTHLPVVDSPRL